MNKPVSTLPEDASAQGTAFLAKGLLRRGFKICKLKFDSLWPTLILGIMIWTQIYLAQKGFCKSCKFPGQLVLEMKNFQKYQQIFNNVIYQFSFKRGWSLSFRFRWAKKQINVTKTKSSSKVSSKGDFISGFMLNNEIWFPILF